MECRRPRRSRVSPARSNKLLGITVSIGLSSNKFLAKIASDLDKPRGFAVLGSREAAAFLAPKPVTLIFGVGRMAQQRLARDGLRTIGDLQRAGERELMRRYGAEGARLSRLARGLDDRPVKAEREAKSISAETTFDRDIADFRPLELRLWRLAEKVSARLKANDARRLDGDAQAQDRRFPHPHARAFVRSSDPACRPDLRRRARSPGARNRRHACFA